MSNSFVIESDSVIVSDPCYDTSFINDTISNDGHSSNDFRPNLLIKSVKKGTWYSYVKYNNDDRVYILYAFHSNFTNMAWTENKLNEK